MSKHHRWGGTGAPNWKPEIWENEPPQVKSVREALERQIERGEQDRAKIEAVAAARIAALEKEIDVWRVAWLDFKVACVACLVLGAAAGFIVCLVTR